MEHFERIERAEWIGALRFRLRFADGTEIECEVEDHGDAVAVLPCDPERREALLVRRRRAPSGLAATFEAHAGRFEGAIRPPARPVKRWRLDCPGFDTAGECDL